MSRQRVRVEPGGDLGREQLPDDAARAQRAAPAVRSAWIVAVLCVLAFVLAIVVAKQLFPYLSRNPDETAYIMQSRMVRAGEISLPAATHAPFFRPALSAPHDGKIVFLYTPEWPAVLGVSSALFGTSVVALALTAAATVAVVYLFARELFERRVALVAAAIFALSPIFVVQTGTRLSYVFGVLTDVTFGWLLLRGLRTGSRWSYVAAGAAFGAAFFGRAFDAVLFAVPLLVYVLCTRRRQLGALLRPLAWFLLGVAPLLVVTALVNQNLMGSIFSFPENVVGAHSTFGWGKKLAFQPPPGQRPVPIDFSVGNAFLTLWRNVIEVRAWIFGGVLAVLVAVVGLIRVRPKARDWLLLGIIAAFPVGYLFWYGIYTATSTYHGVYSYGPYYYFPAFVALALLVARGLVGLLEGRRFAVVAVVAVVLVATTAVLMRNPVHNATQNAASQRRALRLFASVPKHDALVVLPQYWIGSPYATLTNDPDLKNPVLYALDQGDRNVELFQRFRARRAFIVAERFDAGADIFSASPRHVIEPTALEPLSSWTVSMRVRNPGSQRYVIAYVAEGDHVVQQVLDTHSTTGATYDARFTVFEPGAHITGTGSQLVLERADHSRLTVGVALGSSPDLAAAERYEYRYPYAAAPGETQVVTTPSQWHRLAFLNGKVAWIAQDVGPVLTRPAPPGT
ncbi:MAG TPA: glycosyltransferase family 39 protein [Acidimicrobiia bacterium]|jgi:4-amino-4-deoxy-L-arabinose transferase-like glycosyltransferase